MTGWLLMPALLGLCLFVGLHTRLRAGFVPITVAAGAVCTLYLSGLCGSLLVGLYGIIAAGLAALLYCIVRKGMQIPPRFSEAWPVLVFLGGSVAYHLIITRGAPLA